MLAQPNSRQGSREFREDSRERVKDRDFEYLRYLLHANPTGLPCSCFILFSGLRECPQASREEQNISNVMCSYFPCYLVIELLGLWD